MHPARLAQRLRAGIRDPLTHASARENGTRWSKHGGLIFFVLLIYGSPGWIEVYTMRQEARLIDKEDLNRLEDRLKRGIPKWEQSHFIELVVPQLVATLQKYIKLEPRH